MSIVKEILKDKGSDIWSITPETKLIDALTFMVEKNIGAVLVLDNDKIKGIFSERDYVRNSVSKGLLPEDTPVQDIMTKKILFVSPLETTENCMALMTAKGIRHLPVINKDKLVGMISIRDIVYKVVEDQKFSIDQLERYVSGKMY